MNDELKAVRNLGAELGAAKAEIEVLREQVKVLQSDANSWQSGYDKGRNDGGKHRKSEVEQLRQHKNEYMDAAEVTRKALLAEIESLRNGLKNARYRIEQGRVWNGMDWTLTGLHAHQQQKALDEIEAALSQQPEPTDTYTAVDMATAAAQGFRDGQAAVEQAVAQDERESFEAWADQQWPGAKRQQLERDEYGQYKNAIYRDFWTGWQARATRPEQTEQQPPYPHEAMDVIATSRYQVVASGSGPLSRYYVRAGDGKCELYRGGKSDCEHVARKLAGAFLDGGLTAFGLYATPIAQTVPAQDERDFSPDHTLFSEIRCSMPVNDDGEETRYIINEQQLQRIRALEFNRPAQTEQQPVAWADAQQLKALVRDYSASCAVWNSQGRSRVPLYAAPIAQTAPQGKFRMGDLVKKSTGSEWEGRVVGWYSTEQTKEGYAVESSAHRNSVQIYPAKALEAVE